MARKVLITDDNEKNRKLLRVILSKNGYDVIEADNGEKAVEITNTDIPDIILMDYRMPIMDGIEATRIIKSKTSPPIPVFIVTSSAMPGDSERIRKESGCDMLFTKPIDYKALLTEIQQITGEQP